MVRLFTMVAVNLLVHFLALPWVYSVWMAPVPWSFWVLCYGWPGPCSYYVGLRRLSFLGGPVLLLLEERGGEGPVWIANGGQGLGWSAAGICIQVLFFLFVFSEMWGPVAFYILPLLSAPAGHLPRLFTWTCVPRTLMTV